MPDLEVALDLQVREGSSSRSLNTSDFKASATGAATQDTLVDLLAAVGALAPPGVYRVAAGVNLSGHRLVVPREDDSVVYADNATLEDIGVPVWLTTGAIAAGDIGPVVYLGVVSESSWAWTPRQPVYLGANGALTQTPPVSPAAAFLLEVALAVSATALFFNPKSPIVLS